MQPPKNGLLRLMLYPFSMIYGLIIFVRNFLFDYDFIKKHEFQIPVISVGNITVGGTGKTPHIEYLIRLLRDEFEVATLSRGYKRKTRKFILGGQDSGIPDIGDEPVQIKKKFPDTHVAVDRKRVHGVRKLLKTIPELDVILLDDAFQHRYVTPGLSILLVDYNRPLSSDLLLPAGRLREHAFEKKRAHIIMITKCPDRVKPIEKRLVIKELNPFPYQKLYFSNLVYDEPRPVFPEAPEISKSQMKTLKPGILMITGIAFPRLFKKHLRSISPRIQELIYPDHYAFKNKDLQKITASFENMENASKFVITTEKDAIRLRAIPEIKPGLREKMYYIPVRIRILNDQEENFNNQILNYVKHNKRDSILHR